MLRQPACFRSTDPGLRDWKETYTTKKVFIASASIPIDSETSFKELIELNFLGDVNLVSFAVIFLCYAFLDHQTNCATQTHHPLRPPLLLEANPPTANLACRPMSPKTSTIKSEAPLITSGWSVKVSIQFTKPPSFTTRDTRSRSPPLATCSCARRFKAQTRAILAPSSTVKLEPSLPRPTSSPFQKEFALKSLLDYPTIQKGYNLRLGKLHLVVQSLILLFWKLSLTYHIPINDYLKTFNPQF